MDEFSGLLDGPKAQDAFLLRVVFDPPWSIRVQDRAPLALIAMVRGHGWVMSDDGDPIAVGAGDLVIARGPDPYTMADAPTTAPQVLVHPGDHCATPDGEPLAETLRLGVRTWGTNPDGDTLMLVGTYHLDSQVSRRLLDALPPLVTISTDGWKTPLIPLLATEIASDEPGQDAVLDRLLDLLLVAALRDWFSRPDTPTPAWYRATRDPVVGRAVQLLQHHPERAWTVATLAAEVGLSRAALARRFHDLVGEPPMAYLAGWRLALAADLLSEPGITLDTVAGQVGYSTGFALSTAFKRHHGVTPRHYRHHHAT